MAAVDMTDVPAGDWSALLVGHQWPGSATLGLLAAAAEQRTAANNDHENYADLLRAIRAQNLDIQEGAAAETARAIFHSGEQTARAIAAKNSGKAASYRAGHQAVSQLRAELQQIAEQGNAAIREVMQSGQPDAGRRAAIVAIVIDAQQRANARAAIRCADLFPAVHQVLGAEPAGHTAGDFAHLHGLALPTAFGSPNTEHVDAAVNRMMSQQSDGAESPATSGAVPPATPGAGDGVVLHDTATLHDRATPQTARPGASTAVALPVALIRIPDEGPLAQPSAAAPPANSTLPRINSAVSTATGAPARVAPVAAARFAPVQNPGGLLRYGSGQPSPTVTGPAPAAPRSAPTAGNTGLPGPTTLVPRRTPAAHAGVTTATAIPAAEPQDRTRLRRLLEAVARQCPTVRWAIGERADGSTVITTDLAGGWVPPHVRIPHGVSLLGPANRSGDARTLPDATDLDTTGLGPTTFCVSYRPGDPLTPSDDAEPVPMSLAGQHGAAADDLGWELAQATRWRDGLPRIAHTLARALGSDTGYLDSEARLLRDHVAAAAENVLGGYPETANGYEVANWQLLAAIAALLDGETSCAAYHFAWFRAGNHG